MLTSADSRLSQAEFRARFPMLERVAHLASCSLGARSRDLDAAMGSMLTAMAERGAPWDVFEEQARDARHGFAALIGAGAEQIALVPNATVGAYQVASTIDWSRRSTIVTCEAEFPSIAQVWLAQQARGATVAFAGNPDGTVSAADYLAAIDERTALVSIPFVTYRDGVRLPVAEIARAAHRVGARVFVDAYQAVGVEPVDAIALGCDYLVAGSLKYLLGLPGVAFLFVAGERVEDSLPQLTGWFGRVDPFAFDPHRLDFPSAARRYETGTPATPALFAANAGLGLIAGLDLGTVRDHVAELVSSTAAELTDLGQQLASPSDPAARGAHLAMRHADPAGLARWLATQDIVVSPRGPVVRLSFHYYNTLADARRVCDAIARYRSVPAGRSGATSPEGKGQ